MEVIVSCRNSAIRDGVKAHAHEKAEELGEIYNKMTTIRVVLDKSKSEKKAEFILHGKSVDIEADATAEDVYNAIDAAATKAKKQLRKHMDRIQDHHKQ